MADKITGNTIYDLDHQCGEDSIWNAFIESFEGYDIPHAQVPYYVVVSGGSIDTGTTYTIKFANEDGTILSTMTVNGGTTPKYTGETPVKEDTVGYTYSFAGWDPSIQKATKDITYTAKFDAVAKKFDLVINGENKGQIPYDSIVSISAVTAAINPEYLDNKKYTVQWTDADGAPVDMNATFKMDENGLTLNYTATPVNHTITIKVDGEVYTAITTGYGQTIEAVADPEKVGYEFKGWNPAIPATMPANDINVVAKFEAIKYTIVFQNYDGTVLSSKAVAYDTMPVAPAQPKRNADVEYTYAFTGWDKEITKVTGDTTYTAQYQETAREYTIKFLAADNVTVLQTEVLTAHTMPSYTAATPTKASTIQYKYEFLDWSPALVEVTGNATYKPTFIEILRSYDITFKLNNGEEDLVLSVEYGKKPEMTDPSKASTVEFEYEFIGWNPAIVAVTGEATYDAQYKETKRKYALVINGESTEVEYGTEIKISDIVKDLDPEYLDDTKYDTEIKANGEVVAIDDTVVMDENGINVVVNATPVQYTITYVLDNGSEDVVKTYDYKATIEDVDTPSKTGYEFRKWDSVIPETMPNKNLEIKAKYDAIVRTIVINGVETGITCEDVITLPTNVDKPGYSYEWTASTGTIEDGKFSMTPEEIEAAGNVEVNPEYTAEERTINIKIDGALADTISGTCESDPIDLSKYVEDRTESGYTFNWDENPNVKDGVLTIPATTAETLEVSGSYSKIPVSIRVEISTDTDVEDESEIKATITGLTWGETFDLYKWLKDNYAFDPTIIIEGYKFKWDSDLEIVDGKVTPAFQKVPYEIYGAYEEEIADSHAYMGVQILKDDGSYDKDSLVEAFDCNDGESNYELIFSVPVDSDIKQLNDLVTLYQDSVNTQVEEEYIDETEADDYENLQEAKHNLAEYQTTHTYSFILNIPKAYYDETTFNIANGIGSEINDWEHKMDEDFVTFIKKDKTLIPDGESETPFNLTITL